jgi:uncharacterized protein YqeY
MSWNGEKGAEGQPGYSTIIEWIKADRMQAMKNKDELKKNLLSTLVGEASKEDKIPSDEKVIATIKKFIKGAEETLKALKGMDLNVLAAAGSKPMQEMIILESYLPKQLTEEEIRCFIIDVIGDCSDKPVKVNLGMIMKIFKEDYEGQYDGALVSKIAKELTK